jgi:hypothetical protein
MESRIMTVYIVTYGEYDDFGLEAVFSTQEKADTYIQEAGKYNRSSMEMIVDEYDGKVSTPIWSSAINLEDGSQAWAPKEKPTYIMWTKGQESEGQIIIDAVACGMSSISLEHAHQVAVECRQEYLRNKGLNAKQSSPKKVR